MNKSEYEEISPYLKNTSLFYQIGEELQQKILKQINSYIYYILKNIVDSQREITPNEREDYSRYLRDYFKI